MYLKLIEKCQGIADLASFLSSSLEFRDFLYKIFHIIFYLFFIFVPLTVLRGQHKDTAVCQLASQSGTARSSSWSFGGAESIQETIKLPHLVDLSLFSLYTILLREFFFSCENFLIFFFGFIVTVNMFSFYVTILRSHCKISCTGYM